jgi:hypothetical protein
MMPAWILVPLGLCLVLAGICAGLYVGERGRRRMLERWVASGSPTPPPRAVVRDQVEAEDRLLDYEREVSKATVERMEAAYTAELRARQIPFDPKQLREEIKLMAAGINVDVPG